jgi:hypothetical protein
MDFIYVVFHQFETGQREGTIYSRVCTLYSTLCEWLVTVIKGPEMEFVTVVFHHFETGLKGGTIYARVCIQNAFCLVCN